MGNNQALQVGAESLSGLLGGLLAALMVKLSLVVLGLVAIAGALALRSMPERARVEEPRARKVS